MPDSYLYNDAYRATLGYKCYFTLDELIEKHDLTYGKEILLPNGEYIRKMLLIQNQEHKYFFCMVPCFSALQPIRESEPTLIWELQS